MLRSRTHFFSLYTCLRMHIHLLFVSFSIEELLLRHISSISILKHVCLLFFLQASVGRMLFNVSPIMSHAVDKNSFEATVIGGTQLCSRRMLQQIMYCVGGVSVLFPLITQWCNFENEVGESEKTPLMQSTRECVMGEVIELIASLLDENVANQQQMHIVSGFSVLGFLLQSVPPQQLNLETLSALKHLFNVVSNSGIQFVPVPCTDSFHLMIFSFATILSLYFYCNAPQGWQSCLWRRLYLAYFLILLSGSVLFTRCNVNYTCF